MSNGVKRDEYKYEDIRKNVIFAVVGTTTAIAPYGSIVAFDPSDSEWKAFTGDTPVEGKLGIITEKEGTTAGGVGQILLAGIVKEHTEMNITPARKNELFKSFIFLA